MVETLYIKDGSDVVEIVEPKGYSGIQAIAVADADTDNIVTPRLDTSKNTVRVGLYVWDTVGLDWVRMVQPSINVNADDLTVTMGDVEALQANTYWKRSKPYIHASGRLKYYCKNTDIDANETDTDWWIWKYSDDAIPGTEGPRLGAVNTEAAINALSWQT